MEHRFTGKVVVVTGAGSGIGAATAHRFAAEGATVVVVGRTVEKLERTAATAEGAVEVAVGDVADETLIARVVDAAAERHGRLDVLVNNAATAAIGTVDQLHAAAWRRVMAVDVDAVFFASRAALPHLRKVRGCIVNLGSVSALGADWGLAAYNTAKGAVVNLTNAMALDQAAEGVRVNAVHPGLTITEMSAPNLENEQVMASFRQRIPMGRPGLPSEGRRRDRVPGERRRGVRHRCTPHGRRGDAQLERSAPDVLRAGTVVGVTSGRTCPAPPVAVARVRRIRTARPVPGDGICGFRCESVGEPPQRRWNEWLGTGRGAGWSA